MNNISVLKISIAAFSLMLTNYKKIIALSIIPIILMLPMIFSVSDILNQIEVNGIKNVELDLEVLIYSIAFIYGYSSLNINLYRLISLSRHSTFKFGLSPANISLKFIALSILIALFNIAPFILKVPLLEPIIFVLIAHLMLNLVIIAIDNKPKKWQISLIDRLSITLLQFIIPVLIISIVSYIGIFAVVIFKLLLIYWSAINLGLIFNKLYLSSEV